jgi:F0F1-type ATP synthase assembly protein I
MDRNQIRCLSRYGTAGIEFALCFVLPVGAGLWADARWGTDPWLTLAGAVLGFTAGVYRLVRIARELREDNADNDGRET